MFWLWRSPQTQPYHYPTICVIAKKVVISKLACWSGCVAPLVMIFGGVWLQNMGMLFLLPMALYYVTIEYKDWLHIGLVTLVCAPAIWCDGSWQAKQEKGLSLWYGHVGFPLCDWNGVKCLGIWLELPFENLVKCVTSIQSNRSHLYSAVTPVLNYENAFGILYP